MPKLSDRLGRVKTAPGTSRAESKAGTRQGTLKEEKTESSVASFDRLQIPSPQFGKPAVLVRASVGERGMLTDQVLKAGIGNSPARKRPTSAVPPGLKLDDSGLDIGPLSVGHSAHSLPKEQSDITLHPVGPGDQHLDPGNIWPASGGPVYPAHHRSLPAGTRTTFALEPDGFSKIPGRPGPGPAQAPPKPPGVAPNWTQTAPPIEAAVAPRTSESMASEPSLRQF